MGIGSGSSIGSSGEKVIADKLKQAYSTRHQQLCIFDVGANKGEFVELMENHLQGIPIQIHAFEPSKYTFDVLCGNVKSHSNITLHNVALGKQDGELELFYDEPGSGLASLSKRELSHYGIDFKYSEKVKVDTLDNYCEKHDIQAIDLLKLDVEGHELDVLYGGVCTIRNHKITMLSFEFGGCNIDSRTYFQDFYYFLRQNGDFEIYRITPSGYLMPIRQYKETHEQFRTTVFLALRRQ
jgi:FkbM family methyltransferase